MGSIKATIGQRLQRERKSLRLTQVEFADAIGRSRHTVAWWETDRSIPDVCDLSRMCEIGVDGSWVLHGKRAAVQASSNINWNLMGVIAATLGAWQIENELMLDAERAEDLLRMLYDANSAHDSIDIASIERMIKLVTVSWLR